MWQYSSMSNREESPIFALSRETISKSSSSMVAILFELRFAEIIST